MARRRDEIWSVPANVARLGTCFDKDLAAELGISISAVTQARRKRGIPHHSRPRDYRRWTEAEEKIIRSGATDAEIAEQVSRRRKAVRHSRLNRGIPAADPIERLYDLARKAAEPPRPA